MQSTNSIQPNSSVAPFIVEVKPLVKCCCPKCKSDNTIIQKGNNRDFITCCNCYAMSYI